MTRWSSLPPLCFLLFGCALHLDAKLVTGLFGRADLMWTALLTASLLSVYLANQQMTQWLTLMVGFTTLGVSSAILGICSSNGLAMPILSPFALSWICLLLLSISLAAMVGGRASLETARNSAWRVSAMTMFMAFVVPLTYAHAASVQERERFVEALKAQRYQLARSQSQIALAVEPNAFVLETPIHTIVEELDKQIQQLERFVQQRLPANPNSAQIGQRAIALMHLDRNQAALDLLGPIASPNVPIALDYCGLCTQRLEMWTESATYYEQARDHWKSQPASPQRSQALVSAYRGIAFAERKLDHANAATEAYLNALALAPSAEIHFLLARHYEEQQMTSQARDHVEKAMQLAPDEFGQQGQDLLDKMALTHFGCLQLGRQPSTSP